MICETCSGAKPLITWDTCMRQCTLTAPRIAPSWGARQDNETNQYNSVAHSHWRGMQLHSYTEVMLHVTPRQKKIGPQWNQKEMK